MSKEDVIWLIIERRKECGMGLCGRYGAIARWLFREHNIVASDSYVSQIIKDWDG